MEQKMIDGVQIDILDLDELNEEELSDLSSAVSAREDAYASYSGFKVGACIRTNDGIQYIGWNVENRVFSVLHAEHNAIGRIVSESRGSGIKRITVMASRKGEHTEKPVFICGDCRQIISDHLRPQDKPQAIMSGTKGKIYRAAFRDLLPLAFAEKF